MGGASAESTNLGSVGRFQLISRLARGGMAELFVARAAGLGRLDRLVVVKRILPQFAEDPEFRRMFIDEADVTASLEHPNVLHVHDSGVDDNGQYYFAMEYVHGGDLRTLLRTLGKEGERLPLEHALRIAIDVCAGLHHAHEMTLPDGTHAGVVHRDVSPNNILLSYEGAVKVADFGIARMEARTRVTQAGTRKGKLGYMSPEQARADRIDRRTDVFAIGILLFEMTTMRRLFRGDNELAVLHQIVYEQTPRPSEHVAGYPPQLESIVMRALAKDPAQRFITARSLQLELERFAHEQGLALSHDALGRFLVGVLGERPHPSTLVGNEPAPSAPRSSSQPSLAPRLPRQAEAWTQALEPEAPTQLYSREASGRAVVPATVPGVPDPGEDEVVMLARRRNNAIIAGAGAAILAGVVAIALVLAKRAREPDPQPAASTQGEPPPVGPSPSATPVGTVPQPEQGPGFELGTDAEREPTGQPQADAVAGSHEPPAQQPGLRDEPEPEPEEPEPRQTKKKKKTKKSGGATKKPKKKTPTNPDRPELDTLLPG